MANKKKARTKNPPVPDKWTVMVYLAGDNNLSEEMIYAIKEMYRVGVNKYVDVIIQFDPSGIGPPVRRYIISTRVPRGLAPRDPRVVPGLRDDGKLEALAIPVKDIPVAALVQRQATVAASGTTVFQQIRELQKDAVRLSAENSADPRVLREFICSTKKDHEAGHYMVVLSGHGSGALGDFLTDQTPAGEPSSLGISGLGWVFREVMKAPKNGKKIDIVGMDSCLMSMVEVCYELCDSVRILIGAEGFEAATGWPYHRILKTLRNPRTAANAKLTAAKIVKDYIKYYTDYEMIGASTDQSACNLESFNTRLVPAIRRLAEKLFSGLDYRTVKDAITLSHWEAQSYKGEQYVDLYDFCDQLRIRCERLKTLTISNPQLKDEVDPFVLAAVQGDDRAECDAATRLLLYNQLDSEQKEAMTVYALHGQQGKKEVAEELWKETIVELKLKHKGAVKALMDDNRQEIRQLCSIHLDPNQEELLDKRLKELDINKKLEDLEKDVKLRDTEKDEKRRELKKEKDLITESVVQLITDNLNEISNSCEEVMKAIEGGNARVVLRSCYSGAAFQHSHGLSIFFPWSEGPELDEYEKLNFATGTGWGGFIRKYVQVTRRERRNQDKHLGEIPVRVKPNASPLVSILAPLFSPMRSDINSRGSIFGAGGMKNPPDGFYRDV